jgi:hypothetical protein
VHAVARRRSDAAWARARMDRVLCGDDAVVAAAGGGRRRLGRGEAGVRRRRRTKQATQAGPRGLLGSPLFSYLRLELAKQDWANRTTEVGLCCRGQMLGGRP